MEKIKKILSFFLAVILVVSIVPMTKINVSAEDEGWYRPVDKAYWVITDHYGKRNAPTSTASTWHWGIDIGGSGIGGKPVRATRSGTVSDIYLNTGAYGYAVEIRHDNGYGSMYMHMKSKPTVVMNQRVNQGDTIGYVGSTGDSTGDHLDFRIFSGNGHISYSNTEGGRGNTVDPESFSYKDTLSPTTYRIQYNLNGGSFKSNLDSTAEWDSTSGTHVIQQKNPTKTTYDGNYGGSNWNWFTVEQPTKEGYSFAGWDISGMDTTTHYYWDTAQNKSMNFNSTTLSVKCTDFRGLRSTDGLVTFSAKWTPNTYTVAYNANGGSGAPGNQTKTYGTNLTLSTTTPTRTGYAFQGWATSASATSANYQPGATYSNNANVTLYAVWKGCIVWSDWSTTKPSSGEYESRTEYRYKDKQIIKNGSSSVSGYTFVSKDLISTSYNIWDPWRTSADANTSDANYSYENSLESTTSYRYNAFYNSSGNVWYWYNASGVNNPRYLSVFSSKNASADGSDDGHGYVNAEKTLTVDGTSSKLGTIYGIFTWSVSNGSTTGNATHTNSFTSGASITPIYTTGTAVTLRRNVQKKYQYTHYKWGDWSGWSTTAVSGNDNREVQTRTVYRYKVSTQHSFGGWTKTKDPTCTATGTQTRKCSVCGTVETGSIAALGHSYGAWVNDVAAGVRKRTCSRCTNVETETYFYNISYNANGGSGAPSAQTKTKDAALTLSSTTPTREGYAFQGWATSANATSAAYQPGGSYTSNAAVTLYAVWKPYVLTVYYNSNGGVIGNTTYNATADSNGLLSVYDTAEYGKTFGAYGLTNVDSEVFDLSKTGYHLLLNKEWKADNGAQLSQGDNTYTAQQVAALCGKDLTKGDVSVTLYANWIANTYRIEYNLDGGSFEHEPGGMREWYADWIGNVKEQLNPLITCYDCYYDGSNYWAFFVEEPFKEGYTFDGWEISGMDNCDHYYYDGNLDADIKFNTSTISVRSFEYRNLRSTDGLVTFTAKWESTHTHNYTETVTQKATCTTDGLKTFTCVCGDTYTETIKATGHKNTIFITEFNPTCTEPGSEDEYCLDCSELVGTREIPALGHDNSGEWKVEKAATCTENGTKALYCKRCTEKIDTVSIPSLGHNFVLAEKNEKHPHNELYKCTRCPETKTVDSVYSEICPECNFTSTAIDAESCKITGYTGELSSLTVPAELGGKKVVSTATSALKANAKLTEVRFEDGITEIGSLTFMNCSSLKKAVVPASVTTIGTHAFYGCAADFAIYCFRDSYAHQYAVDNDIDFVLMDIAETKNSVIDYTHKLIFTQFTMAADMSVIIGVPKNVVAIPQASIVNGNRETFGTGSTVTVFENNTFSGEYTVIVNGDLDGDGVSDVLDAALAERAANGRETLSDAQAYAANNAADTEISIESYQNVVNRALGA